MGFEPIPKLPLEIIGHIIGSTKSLFHLVGKTQSDEDRRLFLLLLIKLSQVSRSWASETRPFVFEKITITLSSPPAQSSKLTTRIHTAASSLIRRLEGGPKRTPPSRAGAKPLRRLELFLEFVRANPRIGSHVRALHLRSENMTGAPALNACASTLLEVSLTLSELKSLDISWNPRANYGLPAAYKAWWSTEINSAARCALLNLIRLPTITSLKVNCAAVPAHLWSTDASRLEVLDIQYSISSPVSTSSSAIFPTASSSQIAHGGRPFGSLTRIIIKDFTFKLKEIQATIFHARRTLRSLECSLLCPNHHSLAINLMDDTFNLSQMARLQTILFYIDSGGLPPSQVSRFTLRAIDRFPFDHQLVGFSFGMTVRCPGYPHNPFNPSRFLKKFDAVDHLVGEQDIRLHGCKVQKGFVFPAMEPLHLFIHFVQALVALAKLTRRGWRGPGRPFNRKPIFPRLVKCHNFGWKNKCGYDEALFRSFVLRISLVSQTWSQATRPFLFHSVKFSFGAQISATARRHNAVSAVITTLRQAALNVFQNIRGTSLPPVALQRMEELLGLIQSNPQISGYVKHLELEYAPGLASAAEFSQCAATLVHLYDGLHTLNSLDISWKGFWSDPLRRGEPWWMGRLDEVGRQTFQHLIESRPSLRTIHVGGATLPLWLWSSTITNASICYAVPAAAVPSNAAVPSLGSHTAHTCAVLPIQIQTRTKRTLSSLVDLTIVDDSSHINDVWTTISYSRKTMRRLMCGIDLDSATPPPPVGSISTTATTHNHPPGARDKFFVLADFPELRFCSLIFTLKGLPPSEASDWAFQLVEALPWRIVTTFTFKMSLVHCPTAGLAHTPFDPISMFKKLDTLISGHVTSRLSAGGPLMFGAIFYLEIQNPCTACTESGSRIPPPSSPIWNPVTLFPRLNQHNQEGWLGLWVNFKYWDSEKQEKAYFPEYISEPYEILKIRRRQLLLAGRQSR